MTNRKLLFCYSILLFASLSLIPQIANSEPLDNWNLRRPLSTNNDLYKVAYGNGVFVAVGDAGTIITSPDGWTWSLQTSGIHYDLSNVSYLNGLFFAVTGSNKILTSSDGVKWSVRAVGQTTWLSAVTSKIIQSIQQHKILPGAREIDI